MPLTKCAPSDFATDYMKLSVYQNYNSLSVIKGAAGQSACLAVPLDSI
jgi:hypothetical protein